MTDPCCANGAHRAAELNATCSLPQHPPDAIAGIAVAAEPVFVARADLAAMTAIVHAVEEVVALSGWREAVLAAAPAIARHAPGNPGVLYGYDFHLSPAGPRLIEINTNAGGALVGTALLRALDGRWTAPGVPSPRARADEAERAIVASLIDDFAAVRGAGKLPQFAAIVDESPAAQHLHPEFRLFAERLRGLGVEAAILDPRDIEGGAAGVFSAGRRIDLVYNRLTDFWLAAGHLAALRAAWLADAVVLTPHPHGYALHADKRNLARLCDEDFLAGIGVPSATREVLRVGVPRTRIVHPADAEALWRDRDRLFFKPAGSHAGRGAYAGAKLTRAVFARLLEEDYVAQEVVPPTLRRTVVEGVATALKIDLRCYVYRGAVQLVAARLYRGQTTNFRLPGSGFAAVLPTDG